MEPITIEEAMDQLKKAKVSKLPIVNSEGRLITMVTRSDIKKARDFPRMSRDFHGQLLAGARVVAGGWNDDGPQHPGGPWGRASALAEAGADVICIDPSEATNDGQLKMIQAMKAEYPKVDVVAGPVLSCREAKRIAEAGADAIVIGGGQPQEGGHGRAEATALYEVAKYIRENYATCAVIAAGTVLNSGHVLKAFCLGASTVMISEPFSGTDEAPGRGFIHDSGLVKLHNQSSETLHTMRHAVVPGGIVGSRSRLSKDVMLRGLGEPVTSHGSVRSLAPYLMQGVRHGMRDLGIRSIPELHTALDEGEVRLEVVTPYAAEAREARKLKMLTAPHPEVMPVLAPSEMGAL